MVSDTRAAYDALAPVYDGLDRPPRPRALAGPAARPGAHATASREPAPWTWPAARERASCRSCVAASTSPPATSPPRWPRAPGAARAGTACACGWPTCAACRSLRERRPRHLPGRRRQLPDRSGRAARGAGRHAREPAARRAARVRRQHAGHLSRGLLRRASPGPTAADLRVGRRAARRSRRAGCSPRRCRRGAASRRARCWPRAATCSATTARASSSARCATPTWSRSSCTAAPRTARPSVRRTSSGT